MPNNNFFRHNPGVGKFAREFLLFASSTVAFQGSKFLVYMVAAKFLGPEKYGIWNVLVLIGMYALYSDFGVLNAMNREVPFYKGSNNSKMIAQIRHISFSVVSTASLVMVVVIILASGIFNLNPLMANSLKLFTAYLLTQKLFKYFQIYLKSDCQFAVLSYQQFLLAGCFLVFSIPLTILYDLYGLILGQSLTFLIAIFFVLKINSFDIRFNFDWKKIISLVKIGFPIMAVGMAYGFLTTVDRWVILKFLGLESLGYYSIAITVFGAAMLLPLVIAEQVYPRMAKMYGETKNPQVLIPLLFKQIVIAVTISIVVIVAIYFTFPLLVKNYMPEYVPGIRVTNIMLIGLFFLPIGYSLGGFLNILNKQVLYLAIQCLMIFVNMALSIYNVKKGMGIEGVAIATVITYVLYMLLLVLLSGFLLFGNRKKLQQA